MKSADPHQPGGVSQRRQRPPSPRHHSYLGPSRLATGEGWPRGETVIDLTFSRTAFCSRGRRDLRVNRLESEGSPADPVSRCYPTPPTLSALSFGIGGILTFPA